MDVAKGFPDRFPQRISLNSRIHNSRDDNPLHVDNQSCNHHGLAPIPDEDHEDCVRKPDTKDVDHETGSPHINKFTLAVGLGTKRVERNHKGHVCCIVREKHKDNEIADPLLG